MTRLLSELRRLYAPRPSAALPWAGHPSLVDDEGCVRAMALTLARPADWTVLSPVWSAVQSEWSLPAPGIAVSGVDAYQLWFSVEDPVSMADARIFLEFLRTSLLGHVDLARVGLLPAAEAAASPDRWHAGLLPGAEVLQGQWSAFVAPDLAPVFAEGPWLDIPPSAEGQADLLSRLHSIPSELWQQVLTQAKRAGESARDIAADASRTEVSAVTSFDEADPRRFLLRVMNDEGVALALRIEAAKALLSAGQTSAER